jgi:hypothetical protein
MKRILFCFFLLIYCFTEVKAQENSLFWEISKKKYKTSYLYGTIHVIDKRVFNFGEQVLPALHKCKAYAGEIIMEAKDAFAIIPYLFEKDSAKQCKNVLNVQEYNSLEVLVSEKLGKEMLPILPKTSPYIAALLLSIPNDFSENPGALFLDSYFQAQADSLGKKLISLETIKSQMAYVQMIEINAQKEHLLRVMEYDSAAFDFEQMLEIYIAEDLERIQEMIIEAGDEDPLITNEFLVGRNSIHKEGIVKAMKEQSTFIAIGAAHLPGAEGVIALLKKEGFSLKAIPNNP